MTSYPQHPEKWQSPSVLKPNMRIKWLEKLGHGPRFKMPANYILCYKGVPVAETLKPFLCEHQYFSGYHFSVFLDRELAVVSTLPLGGAATATLVEELIACGAKQFVALGQAGSLQARTAIGDFVVCNKALRDEGVSHHYLPPARYVEVEPKFSDEIGQSLQDDLHGYKIHRGASWTTDAVYRETAEEIEGYRAEGIEVVDMEAASLFAVAQAFQLKAAAVFRVSDRFVDQPGAAQSLGWEVEADWDKAKKDLGQVLSRLIEMSNWTRRVQKG